MEVTRERDRAAAGRGQRLGVVLIAVGVAGILWGVFHVLNSIGGYESRDFAHRKRDFEVRSIVHETFPGGFLRAMVGLSIALLGGRVRRRALERASDDATPEPAER